jgi:hypothetical protein
VYTIGGGRKIADIAESIGDVVPDAAFDDELLK